MKKKETQISNQFLFWDGVFLSWEDAICSAGDVDGEKGFSNEKWFERILEQLSFFRSEIKEFGIAVPPRPTNLPTVVSLTNSKTIVDIGGSSGWIYDYLDSIELPSEIKKYSILEISDIISRSKRFNHSRKVQFYTDFKKIRSCDLLYTNSVIQYFPTNEYLIEIIDQVKPKYILADDLYAGDNEEFFSNQISYEKKFPHRFLNFKKFRKEISKEGYRMILKQPFDTPILGKYQPKPMGSLPEKI
ncbi:hypothetical protein LEP1GSC019_3729 [Leptospira interrogans serovar Pyrogenes str. 2006006960]|nr:methyltransferase, TIGR04325 family [Leptospira interrogans]EKR17038.1 hypothetical protein LEP1GSC019_3729 [Leptospira interrogans serovar Pyrogenes str. 2006006960]